jgi:hypothetical protein
MTITVNYDDFSDSFTGRYKNNFSYEGKRALFNYLEEYESETGEQIELDSVALCCEYAEYEDLTELRKDYPDVESMGDLMDHTSVIPVGNKGGFIIQDY